MRISKKAKEENRGKILQVAARLFVEKGFAETTTRDIAGAMGMAAGTMFNYFDNKEVLAMTLVAEAMETGREAYLRRRTGQEDLAEELFLLISSELRMLKPYKGFIGPVLESAMSLFPKNTANSAGEKSRAHHMELVEAITRRQGYSSVPALIAATLYWSLYLGILAFWVRDQSRNQEETLALIDYSLQLFSQTLSGNSHQQ